MGDDRAAATVDPGRSGDWNGWAWPATAATGPTATCSATTSWTRKARPRQRFEAVARFIRDLLAHRWVKTQQAHEQDNPKRVYYLSMEFLIGRSLTNNIINLHGRAARAGGSAARGAGLAPAGRAGAGRRPGQRRPGPAGGLLHRLAGHPAIPGHRLRPALRVRHLPAVDPATATRSSSPTTGCAVPIPGKSPAPARPSRCRSTPPSRCRAADCSSSPTSRATCSASPTTGRWSATAASASTPCGCGPRRPRITSTSPSSPTAISSAPCCTTSRPSR